MTEEESGYETIERLKERAEDALEKFKKKYPPTKSGKPRRVGVVDLYEVLNWLKFTGDVDKEMERQEHRTVLDREDMFRACKLGYEGLEELKEESADKLISLTSDLSLKNYKETLTPLGNFIMGHKVIKEYCQDLLTPKELETAQGYYNEMKEQIAAIDEETNRHIENKYTVTIQRDYGVVERKKKPTGGYGYSTPETVWNVEGVPLRNVDDYAIMDAIRKYEKKTGKNAIWRGARTQPFLRFLKRYQKEHGIKDTKKIIEI